MTSNNSPRPSIAVHSPNSSVSSLSTTDRQPVPPPSSISQRRNRAALRDYYNLTTTAPSSTSSPVRERDTSSPSAASVTSVDGEEGVTAQQQQHHHQAQSPTTSSALDGPDFDAESYVSTLLASSSLEKLLRTAVSVVGDMRGLDGERKALVYDNYSKLIAATDTIGRMRGNMDPLGPIAGTLSPAIAHISETATALSREGKVDVEGVQAAQRVEESHRNQQRTVRWVLQAPERVQALVKGGRKDEAEKDWAEVSGLLDKWNGVKGVEEVRERGIAALAG